MKGRGGKREQKQVMTYFKALRLLTHGSGTLYVDGFVTLRLWELVVNLFLIACF